MFRPYTNLYTCRASLNLDAISRRYAAMNAIFINPTTRNIINSFYFLNSTFYVALGSSRKILGEDGISRIPRTLWRLAIHLHHPDTLFPGINRYYGTRIGMQAISCPLYFVNHNAKNVRLWSAFICASAVCVIFYGDSM